MLKAVIFDVDGTLIDSVDAHTKAWVEAFAHFGRHIDYAEMHHHIGKGGDQLLRAFPSEEEMQKFGADLEQYRKEYFKAKYLPTVKSFLFVREFFQRLLSEGRQIALASSAHGDELEIYKKKARIADLVEKETSKDDVEKSKPYPDIFEAALKKLSDIGLSEAIVVGDTPWDAIAAKRIGLRVLGVLCGGFPESELRAAGCVAIFQDLEDMLGRYDEFLRWGEQ